MSTTVGYTVKRHLIGSLEKTDYLFGNLTRLGKAKSSCWNGVPRLFRGTTELDYFELSAETSLKVFDPEGGPVHLGTRSRTPNYLSYKGVDSGHTSGVGRVDLSDRDQGVVPEP